MPNRHAINYEITAMAARKAMKGYKVTHALPTAELKRVRKLCLGLPETHEKIAWGAPTFRIRGGKIFVMFLNNHHNDGRRAIWCPAPPGAQKNWVVTDPEHFFVPPYVGPYGWLGIRLDTGLPWEVVVELVREGYRMIAPERLAELLDPVAPVEKSATKKPAAARKRRGR
jgi:predicted DNA-binding protein (MmcQ/YjbR family)